MGVGVLLLVGIVLCISLLARVIISHFFTQQVFDHESSMPLVPGINESLFEQENLPTPSPGESKNSPDATEQAKKEKKPRSVRS